MIDRARKRLIQTKALKQTLSQTGAERAAGKIVAKRTSSHGRLAVMGAAGAAYARERLTWNSSARRFGDLYKDMPRRNCASHKSTAA